MRLAFAAMSLKTAPIMCNATVLNYTERKVLTMADLKPCPFCGRKPYIQRRPVAQKKCIYAVKCHCGVLTHFMKRKYETEEIWNRRDGGEENADS